MSAQSEMALKMRIAELEQRVTLLEKVVEKLSENEPKSRRRTKPLNFEILEEKKVG